MMLLVGIVGLMFTVVAALSMSAFAIMVGIEGMAGDGEGRMVTVFCFFLVVVAILLWALAIWQPLYWAGLA